MKIINSEYYIKLWSECPNEIPNELLSETHAQRQRGKSLKQIDSEGGMTPHEICKNFKNEYINTIRSDQQSVEMIIHELKKFNGLL